MQNLKRHPGFAYIGLEIIGVLLAAAAVQTIIVEANVRTPDPIVIKDTSSALGSEISIFHVGDMMFDRGVRTAMQNGYVPLSTFPKDIADLVIANLEGPVTTHTECQQKAYSFRFDTSIPAALYAAGIDAVTIGNNHSLDCYRKGYTDTRKYLEEAEVIPFGGFKIEESVATTTVAGHPIALIGIDATISLLPIIEYEKLISSLASTTDLQIVSIHWGNEYELVESGVQKMLAHSFIEAGADAVFGHHPHVVQPVEIYKEKPIFYSLGNYIFDQTEPETKKGLGVKVSFNNQQVSLVELFPFRIEHAVPIYIEGEARETACAALSVQGAAREGNYCHIKF